MTAKKSNLINEAAAMRNYLCPLAVAELKRSRVIACMLFDTAYPTPEMVLGVRERTSVVEDESDETLDAVALADLRAAKQVAVDVFGSTMATYEPEVIFGCYDAIFSDVSDEEDDGDDEE